jgi:hypothetical protein
MDERERRIGLNEAVFREVNERVREISDTFAVSTDQVDIVCECGNADCTERIALSTQEYESVRAQPNHFAIAPGHAGPPEVEQVIAEHDGWNLVRKAPGTAANLARATNPRET